MREAYKKRRTQMGQVKTVSLDVARSGNIVLEAEHLHYKIGNDLLLQDFTFY